MSLATVASIVGIGSGINSLTGGNLFGGGGGGGGTGGKPQAYVPTGQAAQDQQWQDFMRSLQGAISHGTGAIQPAMDASLAAMLGIDTSGLGPAGRQAGAYSHNLAGEADAIQNLMNAEAGQFLNNQNQLITGGVNTYLAGLDPQNALRNQMQQQVTDASRAGTSARGIGMSPQAAGIENKDVSNFLMNWQNQQLARQLAGLQGMTGAIQQAGVQGTDAGKMWQSALETGGAVPGLLTQGATLPFGMDQMAAMWPMQAANMYGAGMNQNIYSPYSGGMNQIIPYLNYGQGATNQGFGQNQTGLYNTMYGLNMLSHMNNPFAGWGNPFSQGTPTYSQDPNNPTFMGPPVDTSGGGGGGYGYSGGP